MVIPGMGFEISGPGPDGKPPKRANGFDDDLYYDDYFYNDDKLFTNYIPVTVDPGNIIMIGTGAFCVATLLLLPLLVMCGRRCGRRRPESDGAVTAPNTPTDVESPAALWKEEEIVSAPRWNRTAANPNYNPKNRYRDSDDMSVISRDQSTMSRMSRTSRASATSGIRRAVERGRQTAIGARVGGDNGVPVLVKSPVLVQSRGRSRNRDPPSVGVELGEDGQVIKERSMSIFGRIFKKGARGESCSGFEVRADGVVFGEEEKSTKGALGRLIDSLPGTYPDDRPDDFIQVQRHRGGGGSVCGSVTSRASRASRISRASRQSIQQPTRFGRQISFLDAVPSMSRRHHHRTPLDQDDPAWARILDDEDRSQAVMETSHRHNGGGSVASRSLYSRKSKYSQWHPSEESEDTPRHGNTALHKKNSNMASPVDLDKVNPCLPICFATSLWRPRNFCAVLSDAWENLLFLAGMDYESKRVISLAGTFTASLVLESFYDLLIIAMVSKFLGPRVAAAFIVSTTMMELVDALLGGVVDAESTVVAHAIGSGDFKLAGQYVQLGMVIYLILQAPMVYVWWYYMAPLLGTFGLGSAIAELGQEYTRRAVFATLLGGLAEAFYALLDVTDHETFGATVDISFGALRTAAVFYILKFRDGDLNDIAMIYIVVTGVQLLIGVVGAACAGWLKNYVGGMFKSCAFMNFPAVRNILKIAFALSIGEFLAYAEWELLTIFAIALGESEAVAWGIAGSIWDLLESCSEGVAEAIEIRVAMHLGRGRPEEAKMSAYKAIIFSVFLSTFFTAIMFALGDSMSGWFTNVASIAGMIDSIVPYLGIGNVMMTVGMCSWGILGAQGRFRLATVVLLICSWGITMPLTILSVFYFRYDLTGIAAAVVVGYNCVALIISYLVFVSDWERLSNIIIELNDLAGSGGRHVYDDLRWVDLPPEIQEAALKLEYTKAIWDGGLDAPCEDWDWDEFTSEQQNAAMLMGYDESMWNKEDDEDDEDDKRCSHEDDWDDLPPDIRAAAKILGYTKKKWNKGHKIVAMDRPWQKLTPAQQESAKVLGYASDWKGYDGPLIFDDDASWAKLPLQVQSAAMNLGYTKKKWDNGKKPAAEKKKWPELSDSEREAARLMGYEERWKKDDKKLEEGIAENPGLIMKTVTFDNNASWDGLPPIIQTSARTLGYSQKIWDKGGSPETDNKPWSELSQKERDAAHTMGFTESNWKSNEEDATPITIDNAVPVDFDEDASWSKLPPVIQNAATTLGYTAKRWNKDKDPTTVDLDWSELTPEQQAAAITMGYDKDKWGANDDEGSEGEYVATFNQNLSWKRLPLDIQHYLGVLGYTKTIWDRDQKPPSEKMGWSKLSPAEQDAATKLGYNTKWVG